MIKKNTKENWLPIRFKGAASLRKKYAVSNLGRVASFTKHIFEDGKLLSGSITSGYKTLNLHVSSGNGTLYLHREVAKLFVPKQSTAHKVVIHLNYNKADNRAKNLCWCTQAKATEHQQLSPKKLAYKKLQAQQTKGIKLSPQQVKTIKTILVNPKRKYTYKQLAEKYLVSEMTIYRIRRGEIWNKIK